MALSRQAKVLTKNQIQGALAYIGSTRHPVRNRAIFLLSVKGGLRAKEIASLQWNMLTDAEGSLLSHLELDNSASKGKSGGRVIPLNKELLGALTALYEYSPPSQPTAPVIQSERGGKMSPTVITNWFYSLYQSLGFQGCSSHSGRRTFITNAAKMVSQAGGSLRDVQQLAGHASLAMTQRYIEGSNEAKEKLVDLI